MCSQIPLKSNENSPFKGIQIQFFTSTFHLLLVPNIHKISKNIYKVVLVKQNSSGVFKRITLSQVPSW